MSNNREESIALLRQIESQDLIRSLIVQLNKDAKLSGLALELSENLPPKEIIAQLYETLTKLIMNDFDGYLNFLYRVDLSEQVMRSIQTTVPEKIAEHATLLVLKREWQKVFFRNKNL